MGISKEAAAAAVKHFSDKSITVRVPRVDKNGAAVRDPDTQRFAMEDQELAAEHVLGVREDGNQVTITVADGKKHSATKKTGK